MNEVYTNLNNIGALSSVKKLYADYKKIDKNITLKDVKEFLKSKDSYTLHFKNRKKFTRRKYMVSKPGITICVDVAYMKEYKNENDGFQFLVFFIDLFSRFLYIYPAKNIKSQTIVDIMKIFLNESIYNYEKVFTDAGVEFTNRKIVQFFREHNLSWYTTYSKEIKSGVVERVIRTLKEKVHKIITEKNSERYLDFLDNVTKTYNKTPHASLNFKSPMEIHLMTDKDDIFSFRKSLYMKQRKGNSLVAGLLAKGLHVRLTSSRRTQNPFFKGYIHQNTKEIFQIHKVNFDHNPVTYNICDLEGNELKGVFYREELIPVKNSGVYDVKILKTRKYKGKRQYLVKYVNYPASKEKWLEESQLMKKD